MNTSERKQRESFDKMANDYRFWQYSAEALLGSANILRREREREMQTHKGSKSGYRCPHEYLTEEVELMLKAFTIECLLKGLWVKAGHKIAENGKYKKVIQGDEHNLRNLAEKVLGGISEEDGDVLARLGSIGKTLGRYPVARSYKELEFSNKENTLGYSNSWQITNDKESFIDTFADELLRKLSGQQEEG